MFEIAIGIYSKEEEKKNELKSIKHQQFKLIKAESKKTFYL